MTFKWLKIGAEDTVLANNEMNILILKAFFLFSYFWCQTFVRCPRFRKTSSDPEPLKFGLGPDSDPGLTEDVWHQKKHVNKKEGF